MWWCRAYTSLENDFEFLMIWRWVEFPGRFGDVLKFTMICRWMWLCADVLCVSGRAAAELRPLWFLTCLPRAYCTWCYLFKAICTDNNLPPPPHLPHSETQTSPLKLTNQSRCRERLTGTGHKWSFLPAIEGVCLPAITGVSSKYKFKRCQIKPKR